MQYEHKELDNEVRPWWTTSLGSALKWVGILLTPQKNWEKYTSIPYSRVKLHNLFLDQKNNITIAFMVLNYLKITIFRPHSSLTLLGPCLGYFSLSLQ